MGKPGAKKKTHSIFGVDERIVDGNNLDVGVLDSVAEDDTANATKAVDANLDSHFVEWESSVRRASTSVHAAIRAGTTGRRASKAGAGVCCMLCIVF